MNLCLCDCLCVYVRSTISPFLHFSWLVSSPLCAPPWKATAEEVIDEGVRSGELIFHDGKDICVAVAGAREERRKLAMRAIFFLNITKVGDGACCDAINLIGVDIPEGVESMVIAHLRSKQNQS
ncbi:hypothetical protein TrLO_g11371 [Triparma laevis f. longispina]|uniref:Uncharacterized protein n=1 Tax=Triparma laevis f. longispina TaxID=1714387 RepID=A0A9W7F489_9STRA|nr:hypothetical protein TrLO_g11371 [Triparma laevis f. longispina]